MRSLGIIGFGSFGDFAYQKLKRSYIIKAFDPHVDVPLAVRATLQEVAQSDYIMLAVPVDAYEDVITEILPHIPQHAVIIDISSVKTIPTQKLLTLLPDTKRVITHPLFGPQSASHSLAGHTLVMCPEHSDPEEYKAVKRFSESLGLRVIEKSVEEHDREMALVQGLTFFLARSLMNFGVHDIELHTPSFKKLLDLAELERHHSDDLFRTIQLMNPYTTEVRKRFMYSISQLADELNGRPKDDH
jgi:prephenate dehydrogenase